MANIKSKNQQPLDENRKRHGEWFIYYDNGQLMYHWNFVHGLADGLQVGYHYNGKLWFRGYLNMNKKIGYWYYSYKSSDYFLCLI